MSSLENIEYERVFNKFKKSYSYFITGDELVSTRYTCTDQQYKAHFANPWKNIYMKYFMTYMIVMKFMGTFDGFMKFINDEIDSLSIAVSLEYTRWCNDGGREDPGGSRIRKLKYKKGDIINLRLLIRSLIPHLYNEI